jgi:hypothetical protein
MIARTAAALAAWFADRATPLELRPIRRRQRALAALERIGRAP